MTQKQLIETVQQHHPNVGETQIRSWLNEAKARFCRRTKILSGTATTNTVADRRYYDIPTIDSSIIEITRVDYNGYRIPRLVGKPEKYDAS